MLTRVLFIVRFSFALCTRFVRASFSNQAFSTSNVRMKSTSACTPSLGMEL